MKNRDLKIIILILITLLGILSYTLYDLIYKDSSPDAPKQNGAFKATTPEGKLREISEQVKNR